ncbi:MAG TPA: hypothetical protein VLX58_18440 [Bryobacteraceae bacterium]|nr:hypothetical protein [Bryobacteraceae bacterium]
MDFKRSWLVFLCAAGLAGCSADPYKGSVPAPPDRLRPPAEMPSSALPAGEAPPWSATGCVPVGDGSEREAPNASGYIPHVMAK